MVEEILEMVKKIVEMYDFFVNCFLIFIILWGNMEISWKETFDGGACVNLIQKTYKSCKNLQVLWRWMKGKSLERLKNLMDN